MSTTQALPPTPKHRAVKALGLIAALIFVPILGIGLTNGPPTDTALQQQTGTDLSCDFGYGHVVKQTYPKRAQAERSKFNVEASSSPNTGLPNTTMNSTKCEITRSGPDGQDDKDYSYLWHGVDVRCVGEADKHFINVAVANMFLSQQRFGRCDVIRVGPDDYINVGNPDDYIKPGRSR
jgi:hypothetical protein